MIRVAFQSSFTLISDVLRRVTPFLLLIFGMLLGVLALELCFRLLPVTKGLVRVDPPLNWPLINYRPHSPYSYSRNWSLLNSQRGETNNYGHLAKFDYEMDGASIAVVGDSYIEARMNRFEDTIQAQLSDLIEFQRKVYGLGANGLSIADYLILSKQATSEFQPTAFVYVIVDNDLSEAIVRRKGWHYFVPAISWPVYVPEREGPRSWLNDFLAASSLYRYLKGNLGISFDLTAKGVSFPATAPTASIATARRSLEISGIKSFVDQLPKATGLPTQCHIFLLDTDRYAIYDERNASTPIDAVELRDRFMSTAKAAGMTVIDLAPLFIADYAKEKRKFDYYPNDRHWNWRGHHIATLAAKKALQDTAATCLPAQGKYADTFPPMREEREK